MTQSPAERGRKEKGCNRRGAACTSPQPAPDATSPWSGSERAGIGATGERLTRRSRRDRPTARTPAIYRANAARKSAYNRLAEGAVAEEPRAGLVMVLATARSWHRRK